MIRYALKFSGFIALVTAYIILSAIISILIRANFQKRKLLAINTSRFCRMLLLILGIDSSIQTEFGIPAPKGRMVVANHLSYLDIVVLSAIWPAIFVTSYEIKDAPSEGLLAKCAGSIFVDRHSNATILEDLSLITQLLKQGFTVALFPEATSSPGERVLPFKSALFHAALDADLEILPICLNYLTVDGRKVSSSSRDRIFYYGDMLFLPHILGLLRVRSIKVDILLLNPIVAASDRKDAARIAFECISRALIPVSNVSADCGESGCESLAVGC